MKTTIYTFLSCLFIVGLSINVNAQKSSKQSVRTTFLEFPENDLTPYKTFSLRIHHGTHEVNHGFFRNWGINQDVIDKMVEDKMAKNIAFKQLQDVENNPDIWIEVSVGEVKFNLLPELRTYTQGEGDKKKTYYYYDYKVSNPMILRIKDKEGNLLYMSKVDEGVVSLGKKLLGGFTSKTALQSHYAKNAKASLNNMFRKEIKRRLNSFEAETRNVLSFDMRKQSVDIYSGKGKDFDYTELDAVQEEVKAQFASLKETIADPSAVLNKAIAVWDKEIAKAELDKKARISPKVALGLYANKTLSYLYMYDIKNAAISMAEADYFARKAGITTSSGELDKLLRERSKKYENYENNKTVVSNTYEDVVDYFTALKAREKKALYKVTSEKDVTEEFEAEYQKWLNQVEEKEAQIAKQEEEFIAAITKKESAEKAAADAAKNPYEDKVVKSASQGYMIMMMGSMSMNKLTEIPVEMTELTQLNQLILSYNQITSIPPSIGNLTELKVLNLAKNKITALPDELGKLKNLKTLNLKGNPVSEADVEKIQKMLPKCKIKI